MVDKVRTTDRVTGERIAKYLSEGKRFDGRGPLDFRKIIVEKGISKKAEGSVRVKLGETEVIVGVKLGIGEPYPDSPNKGNFMVTAELLPLSSPRFENGPPKFEAIELGRVVDRGLRESGFIDFEKLCIKEGEKVWTVFVDVYSINDGGNLMDAAALGAIIALKIAKLPKYDEEQNKIVFELTNKPIPITDIIPIPVSVHKVGDAFLVDPTREEEDLSKTRVTIGISNGIISSVQKSNSESLSIDEMKKVFEIANEVSKKTLKELQKYF